METIGRVQEGLAFKSMMIILTIPGPFYTKPYKPFGS